MATQESLTTNEAQKRILDIISPQETAEPKEEPKEETENAERQGLQAETSEETSEAVEADTQTDEVEETSVQPAEEEGELPTTITELAEAIEVEPSFLYGLKAKYDLDGETREFTLGEVKDLVQRADRIKTQSEAIEKSRGELETERSKLQETFQTRLAEIDELSAIAEKQLQDEFNDADLKALRRDDPAEYAAKVQELNDKKKSIEEIKSKARAKAEEQKQEAQKDFEKKKAELMQHESAALMEAVPEWKDPDKAKQGTAELFKYLTDLGFSPDDVSSVLDHRVFVMARKAMLFDKGQKSVDVSKKKVKTLPKVIKPGAKKSESDAAAQRRKEGLKKLRKTGDVKDAARLILDGMKSQ